MSRIRRALPDLDRRPGRSVQRRGPTGNQRHRWQVRLAVAAGAFVMAVVSSPLPAAPASAAPPRDTQTPDGADTGAAATATGEGRSGVHTRTSVEAARALHRRLVKQVADEDWPGARATLARARRQLPDGHPLRLRLTGWYALRHGDRERARRLYERLLGRLPGDVEAAINLAGIHLTAGRPAAARRVLARARHHAKDADALRDGLRRLRE
ncbi:tetratricopeptide repeat protein [Arhodomonas sp. AD133]|uniref:tetratricopeptide repeat protein n=1 Tax=Arhodomonas sp. AD133 TaxID=3415009 RepID=UPI003EBFBDC3